MTLCFEVYESEALQFVRTARSPHDGEISGEVFREYRHGQASRELFFAMVSEAAEHAKRLRLPLVLDPSRDASPLRAEFDTTRSGIFPVEESPDDPLTWIGGQDEWALPSHFIGNAASHRRLDGDGTR